MSRDGFISPKIDMEEKLDRIRRQINSKLDNQKHVAIVLSAVEENLQDNKNGPVNYTVAFISLLDEAADPETRAVGNLRLATSACYLLDISLRSMPVSLLREKFAELLIKIAPCITDENADAPLIRSAIGCLEVLLDAQNSQSWENSQELHITPRRCFNALLELSLDPRPKVRKRAQEAVHSVMSRTSAGPAANRIISVIAANFILQSLNSSMQAISSKKKKTPQDDELKTKTIHILRFTALILTTGRWPFPQIEALCSLLLGITRGSDQYLVSTVFDCFENLFKSLKKTSSGSQESEDKCLVVLDLIFSLKPSINHIDLTKSWMMVIVKGMSAYAVHNALKCFAKIPELFGIMAQFLSADIPEVSLNASQCLMATLRETVNDQILLDPPMVDASTYELVNRIITELAQIFIDLLSVRYSHCTRYIIKTLSVAFEKFRLRANPCFLRPLEIIGEYRTSEEDVLEFKGEVEEAIGSAISSMGPDVVLGCLPLNLEDASPERPGRAWLLPLIRDNTRNTKLFTFIRDLEPISQSLESKSGKLAKESLQLKIFQTVIDQIWSTLPRFCELPTDLRNAFTVNFASELSSMMYTKVESRAIICNALKILVESNLLYAGGALKDDLMLQQQFPVIEAQKNLEHLGTMSSNLLAVLFNIYTQTALNSRAFILETIESYLKITSEKDLERTFNNVCGLLRTGMDEESTESAKERPELTATLLDIVVCMTKYLPSNSYSALFSLFGCTVASQDALIQKRAYRILSKLAELELGFKALSVFVSDIENVILDNATLVQTSSKAARLGAIKSLVNLIPFDHMDFIVRIAAEVILSTKDVNEKSRETAFTCLIAMGKRMNEPGNIIRLSMVPGYEEGTKDQPSGISEFFKIIAAGLIGESQHMVSSTIQAFACLVFEFRDIVQESVLLDLYDTIALYLTSNSKEIVKSAIGFVKVAVLSLPTEVIRPKVPELIPSLLRWSHEHNGHFKLKIRHIIERLIRKFGYDFIEAHFPQKDLKLLTNIRKAKRKNKCDKPEEEGNEPDIDGMASTKGSRSINAFDEALHDSSEDESVKYSEGQDNTKNISKQFIMESKDNPLDLLDSQALAHISSIHPTKFHKSDKKDLLDDEMFSFDADGKLVINDKEKPVEDPLESITNGIDAYMDAVKQGPVKGQKNRLKFKKGSRSGANVADDDTDDNLELPRKTLDTKNKISKGLKKSTRFKSRRKL